MLHARLPQKRTTMVRLVQLQTVNKLTMASSYSISLFSPFCHYVEPTRSEILKQLRAGSKGFFDFYPKVWKQNKDEMTRMCFCLPQYSFYVKIVLLYSFFFFQYYQGSWEIEACVFYGLVLMLVAVLLRVVDIFLVDLCQHGVIHLKLNPIRPAVMIYCSKYYIIPA